MSCSNCNQTNNNCGCHRTPCVTAQCDCPAGYFSSDCINNVKAEFTCLSIESGLTLTETLEAIDAGICEKFDSITNYFALVNTGTGVPIYNGVNNLGQKKIRKINKSGSLITVTENTDDITIGLDTNALNTFIEANQKTTVAAQLDAVTGKNIYKNTTTSGDVSTLNFRSLILESQGAGASIIRDLQENTNDLKGRFKSLKSSSLTITETSTEISIDTPSTASIPALYVNDLYVPTYSEWLSENSLQNSGTPVSGFIYRGKGLINAPFTNSTVYTLGSPLTSPTITSNTAIQNSLNGDAAYATPYSYVGAGTRLSPDLENQKIIIQDNQSTYIFAGDLNYSGLNLEIGANVSSTTTGFLIDMDDNTAFDATTSTATITILKSYILQIAGNGFNNSGNTASGATYSTGRILNLLGVSGLIYSATNNINKYLINADITNSGNNNDGNLCMFVECDLKADLQGIYKVGGNGRVDFYGLMQSGTVTNSVNASLKAFHQTGGQVRKFKGTKVDILGNTRTSAITFTPASTFTPIYISQNVTYRGNATNLFHKTTTDVVSLDVTNSISGYGLTLTQIFESSNLWEVNFKENVMASGNIDATKADLTQGNNVSAVNTIGNNFIETLRIYASKDNARVAGLPKYSAFLLQRDVAAADLQPNVEYRIKTAGSPSLGTVGNYLLATGSETGTGVATLIERSIMV